MQAQRACACSQRSSASMSLHLAIPRPGCSPAWPVSASPTASQCALHSSLPVEGFSSNGELSLNRLVGIELRRARCRWRVTVLALSIARFTFPPWPRFRMRSGSASRVCSANTTFHGPLFRGCSYSFMFRPPSLLASRVVPTATGSPAGQLRLLHPSRTCIVAFARIRYAFRPTTGNWRSEDFHLAGFTALSTAPLTTGGKPTLIFLTLSGASTSAEHASSGASASAEHASIQYRVPALPSRQNREGACLL
jgi:hypothetical protein